jgi:glycogen operon protein
MLLVLNAHYDLVEYTLPAYEQNAVWQLLIDTNIPDLDEKRDFAAGCAYGVTGRSLLLFELRP